PPSRPPLRSRADRPRARGIGLCLARVASRGAKHPVPAGARSVVSGQSADGPTLGARATLCERAVSLALLRRQQERHAALVLDVSLRQSRQGASPLRTTERSVS